MAGYLLKMRQSDLLGLDKPAVVCVVDVGAYHVGGHVSDRAEKLARTPQVPSAEVFAQPGEHAKEAISASTLEKLERPGDAHRGREAHEHMDVVRLHLELENFHAVRKRNVAQKKLAILADSRELKRIPCILGLPHQVECILPNPVAMCYQTFHFFIRRRKNFCTAHANLAVRSGCANYAAHPLYRTSVEKGGKARQFLCGLKAASILATL